LKNLSPVGTVAQRQNGLPDEQVVDRSAGLG
jgi:hypothetical protein